MFCAKGADPNLAWGNAPGFRGMETSALKAQFRPVSLIPDIALVEFHPMHAQ